MAYTNPHSKQLSLNIPPGRDTNGFGSVPVDHWVLLDASAGSSTLEANPGYDQIQARFSLVQAGLQPDVPAPVANVPQFHNCAQPHGIGEHLTMQNIIEDNQNQSRTISRGGRPVCIHCSKDFGRVQELQRHVKEMHMPWRRCPFCDFMWTRPGKIKAHIMAEHTERFTAEMLEGIKGLCGQRIVEFLDAYDHSPDMDAMLRSCP